MAVQDGGHVAALDEFKEGVSVLKALRTLEPVAQDTLVKRLGAVPVRFLDRDWVVVKDGQKAVIAKTMFLFEFVCEGVRVALRPSGTEPKAKVYLEVSTPPCSDAGTWAKTCAGAEATMKAMAEEFVRLALARVGK